MFKFALAILAFFVVASSADAQEVRVGVGINTNTHQQARGPRMSPERKAQYEALLAERQVEVMGERPENSRGFIGIRDRFLPKKPNCTEERVHVREDKGTFVRVTCF